MAESFVTTRRFFDDKNYPRGFSRHGDYTIRESQALENHGQAFLELEQGKRQAQTEEEKCFVAFCQGKRPAETFFEKTWQKYRNRISHIKRVYTLSGVAATDNLDDYSAE
ncbi:hypothetical protein CEP49_04315 [Mergibacter septicus]|uniref:DUF413 domain-containing protein n=1 Tax=Mergibacter septicus TaxID=221402 RepID=UPI0011791AE7|nr:DUF413 domain-containing protein [Mergibacter septicus]AWX13833.1 hypothetical protein CEP49_04315 [Mergibacter septicus]